MNEPEKNRAAASNAGEPLAAGAPASPRPDLVPERREPGPANPAPTVPGAVDEASRDSFPASDPPSWTGMTAG